eukprot:CAMPEP_0167774004 /NCGR_PEP_ID=MMETSP0111_2-20121227/1756_1 /TAXON_ID=91324 /ORGANISM="Lotharella globosa, Strain CCCM811" /LENGTH=347 /DNA_ID=CAMNT_0007663747 /DNA_START=11 /DNA_END=1054 /DNA_ORIENTATION=+
MNKSGVQFGGVASVVGLLMLLFSLSLESFFLGITLNGISWVITLLGLRQVVISLLEKKRKVYHKGAIVISGCSTGIGRHAALGLDALGFTVYAGVRKEKDKQSLLAERATIRPVMLDVADNKSVEAAAARVCTEITQENLPLVAIINNAGISPGLPVEYEPISKVQGSYDVNVFGVHRMCQAFLPSLRRSEGRIINVGSVAGTVCRPLKSVYHGTKFAVEGMSNSLRLELAKYNIPVSVIRPGYVKTAFASKQSGDNLPFSKIEGAQYDVYRHLFDNFKKTFISGHAGGSSPQVSTDAIVHAVSSEFPKIRYDVAKAGALPVTAVMWMAWAFPDELGDLYILKKYTN